MIIGERLQQLREEKKMSQGDIEKRTGLLRCYISRVENGHTVPSVETLEKMARAMEIPLYQIFVDPSIKAPANLGSITAATTANGSTVKSKSLAPFLRIIPKLGERDRKLLLHVASGMMRKIKAA